MVLGEGTPKTLRDPLPRGGKGKGAAGSPPCLALLAVEDGEEAKHDGGAGGGEEAPPVIPHGEVGGHHLDAEQHPWIKEVRGCRRGGFGGRQGGMGSVGGSSPLMGAPKTVATPTACAATSISFCLNLFCGEGVHQNPHFLGG